MAQLAENLLDADQRESSPRSSRIPAPVQPALVATGMATAFFPPRPTSRGTTWSCSKFGSIGSIGSIGTVVETSRVGGIDVRCRIWDAAPVHEREKGLPKGFVEQERTWLPR